MQGNLAFGTTPYILQIKQECIHHVSFNNLNDHDLGRAYLKHCQNWTLFGWIDFEKVFPWQQILRAVGTGGQSPPPPGPRFRPYMQKQTVFLQKVLEGYIPPAPQNFRTSYAPDKLLAVKNKWIKRYKPVLFTDKTTDVWSRPLCIYRGIISPKKTGFFTFSG